MTNDPTQPSGDDSTARLDGFGDDQDIILDESQDAEASGVDTADTDRVEASSAADEAEPADSDLSDASDDGADSDLSDASDDDDSDDTDDSEGVALAGAGAAASRRGSSKAASPTKRGATGAATGKDARDKDTDAVDDTVDDSDDDSDDADAVPFELREDTPEPGSEPATGLVSDIRDLSFGQAAGLVSNREMGALGRSALFVVPTIVIVVGIIAGIIFGAMQGEDAGGTPTVAAVGLGDPTQIEQGYGISVLEAADAAEAEQLVRDGEAEAAILPDTTGQSQLGVQIIALSDEPTDLLDRLQPAPEVLYLQQRPVSETVAAGVNWGMAILLLLSVVGLGYGLFSTLLGERRNRIGELVAAAIPAKASAWGRILGATTLALVQAALGVGVVMLGLSIAGQQEVLVALLPALGYFFGLSVFVFAVFMGLYLAVSSSPRPKGRSVGYGIVTGIAVLSALVPLFLASFPTVLMWLSYIPLTSPVAMPVRLLQQELPIWQPLLALGIALVAALVVYAIASSAYASNLLRGTGRGGRTATAKSEKKQLKEAKKEAEAAAEDADAEDADEKRTTDSVATRAKAARPKKGGVALAEREDEDAPGSGDVKSGDADTTDAGAKSARAKRARAKSPARATSPDTKGSVAKGSVAKASGTAGADSTDADAKDTGTKDAGTKGAGAKDAAASKSPASTTRTSSQQRKTPPASKTRRRRKR